MHKQNIVDKNYSKNQKNRVSTIVGLVFCIVLVACSVVLEIVIFYDEALRAMNKVSSWDANGFIMLFEIVPMLVVASIISGFCRKRAVGAAKIILDYLRPATILLGGLVVIPVIGIIIALLLGKK